MSSSMLRSLCAALLVSALGWAPVAGAAPDLDGSVKALAAVPNDAVGDLVGGAGLAGASLVGLTGDVVAALDNNRYTHVVLRGLLSTPIRRMALGLSQLSTGALEGFSNDDYERYPQAESTYLKVDLRNRVWTFRAGLGAALLSVVDVLGDTGQFLLRAPGATGVADKLKGIQTDARGMLVGPAVDGVNDVGVVSFE